MPVAPSVAHAVPPLSPWQSAAAIARRPRWVVTAVFFAFALGLGLWAGSIPLLMQRAGLSATGLGVGLALHSAAYVLAMTLGGWLTHRVDPRRLMGWTLWLHGAAFLAVFTTTSPLAFTLSLVLLGLSAGSVDLAMNTEATTLEREMARPVLTRMHASASASFGIGAIGGSLIASSAGPLACAAVACLTLAPVIWAVARLPPRARAPAHAQSHDPAHAAVDAPPAATPASATAPSTASAQPAPARAHATSSLLLLGGVLGIAIAAENAAQLWSAKFLAQQASELAAFAGAGAAFFSVFQAGGRLFGDQMRQRLGDHRLIGRSLALAAIGFAVVAGSQSVAHAFAVSLLGFALVGAGMACVVPCCFALAARALPERPAAALGQASLIAGAIRLPAPLALGYVATHGSDALAFGGVALALLLAAGLIRLSARLAR